MGCKAEPKSVAGDRRCSGCKKKNCGFGFTKLSHIESIDLSGCCSLTADSLKEIKGTFNHLRYLFVKDCNLATRNVECITTGLGAQSGRGSTCMARLVHLAVPLPRVG
jgi:hypothetical protein